MSAKHTPGPWVVFEHSWSDSSIYAKEGNRFCVCRLSIYDEATQSTQQCLGKEMDANARLIAAAPDLLEALENILCHQPQLIGPDIIEAKQAIAKAKGEQP